MKNLKRIPLTEISYILQENVTGTWEDSVSYNNLKEAKIDLKSYRENSKYGSRLIKRRVLKTFTREFLMSLPTIHKGHFDDVKIESKKYRFLVSRMTIEDGAKVNNEITILKLNSSFNWVEIDKY